MINEPAFFEFIYQERALTKEQLARASDSILDAEEVHKGYYVEKVITPMEQLMKDVFLLTASIRYNEFHVSHATIDGLKGNRMTKEWELDRYFNKPKYPLPPLIW